MGMYSRTYFYPVPAKRMSAGSFELLAVAQLTLCAMIKRRRASAWIGNTGRFTSTATVGEATILSSCAMLARLDGNS
jgi:hypothetical protein